MKRCDLRRAPIQQDPHYHGLLRVVGYVWTKTVKNTAKVLIRAQNNIRGCHEWLDWKEDVHNRSVDQCPLEPTKFFCVGIFPGTYYKREHRVQGPSAKTWMDGNTVQQKRGRTGTLSAETQMNRNTAAQQKRGRTGTLSAEMWSDGNTVGRNVGGWTGTPSDGNAVGHLPFGMGRKPMTIRAFLCARLMWFCMLPIERYSG